MTGWIVRASLGFRHLVVALAHRWGIIRGDGTCVWVELATDPSTS